MTNFQQRLIALTGSACPEKVTELYYVTHPKAAKALLGPFLSEADAECGRVVMRSAGAQVSARSIESLDNLAYWHAHNNGQVVRAFAGAGHLGAAQ